MDKENIIEQIGNNSPLLFLFITVSFLRKQPFYLGGYVAFLFVNDFLNYVIKGIIREKRPSGYSGTTIFDSLFGTKIDVYGMPSYHMQNLLFSCVYLYCVIQNTYLLLFEMLVIMITFYYRYESKKHTSEQLMVGSIVGGIVGYVSYLATKQYIFHKSVFGEKIFSL